MKRLVSIAILAMALSGCGQDTATDKVEKFIKSKDISMLSKARFHSVQKISSRIFITLMKTPYHQPISITN